MHYLPEATIFGSSTPEEGSHEYQTAYEVARILTKAGYQIKNGGYYGTMEAASKGAIDNGRAAIGITMQTFDPKQPNIYCKQEKKKDIFQRLSCLVTNSAIIVVLPGQLGTLTEFFLVWEMLESNQLNPAPKFVCIGENWNMLIDCVMKIQNIKEKDREYITVCSHALAFEGYLDTLISLQSK
jgi:uncharacterized protein (TIGR00725 family)